MLLVIQFEYLIQLLVFNGIPFEFAFAFISILEISEISCVRTFRSAKCTNECNTQFQRENCHYRCIYHSLSHISTIIWSMSMGDFMENISSIRWCVLTFISIKDVFLLIIIIIWFEDVVAVTTPNWNTYNINCALEFHHSFSYTYIFLSW